MPQPYALFHDTRTDTVYRVAADGQSKVAVGSEDVLIADQFNLDQHGYDAEIIPAADPFTQAWLDSVPRVG